MIPAVKPQTRADSTRNAGPRWPLGWTVVARLAGSVRSATGTVKTRAVSFGSTDADRARLAPPAQHRGHDEAADRDVQLGQHAEELDARPGRARSPPRPRAARPAAARRPSGRRPRGRGRRRGRRAGPAWERSELARSMSSSSGPRVALAEEDQHGGLPPRPVLRRQEAAQLQRLDGLHGAHHRIQPARQPLLADRHRPTLRIARARHRHPRPADPTPRGPEIVP